MCKPTDGLSVFRTYCYIVGVLVIGLLVLLITLDTAYCAEYKRELFRHWSDLDNNGLDSRQDTLVIQSLADKTQEVHMVIVMDNKVIDGVWVCPYTGEIVYTPSDLDIDHIVPLKYAWEHGAEKWNNIEREIFANDPENLLVTRDYVNQAKGAAGPDEWLPPNSSYIKTYIDKFIKVCDVYKLECNKQQLLDIRKEYEHVRGHSN